MFFDFSREICYTWYKLIITNMQPEIFKDVLWYEGLYRVSDIGSVMRVKSERVLSHGVHCKGYHLVNLSKNWVEKWYLVHRLVALAFLPNPESKEQVNHIDWVKTNNSLNNLEWNTRKENIVHSIEVLGNTLQKGKFLWDHNTARGVIQYDLKWNEIERFTSWTGASLATGVAGSSITDACRGKRKSAWGFRWKYI